MKKLRLLVLIDTARVGGPGKGVLQLARQLPSERIEFIIGTFQSRRHTSDEFIQRAREQGIDPVIFYEWSRFDLSLIGRIRRFIQRSQVSIVQSHGYKAHLAAFLSLRRNSSIPWIGVLNGWTDENWKTALYHKLDRYTLRFASTLVAVSPELLSVAQEIAPQVPSVLIPNAVDREDLPRHNGGTAIRSLYGNNEILIGVFGRLSPEKGHDLLLHAFCDVSKKHPSAHLLFLGDGPERDRLMHLAQGLGIQRSVEFLGYQSGIRDYFEAIDLLVLPSYHEGHPNVLLEAMIHQVPTLASDIPAIRAVIERGETGWLFRRGDRQDLAKHLNIILSTTRKRWQEVAKAAERSLYPRFSAERRSLRFLKLYERTLRWSNGGKDSSFPTLVSLFEREQSLDMSKGKEKALPRTVRE